MHLTDDFEVVTLKKDEFLTGPADTSAQLRPTKLYVFPEGATDNTPSFAFVLEDGHPTTKYVAQISHNMLSEALIRAARIRESEELEKQVQLSLKYLTTENAKLDFAFKANPKIVQVFAESFALALGKHNYLEMRFSGDVDGKQRSFLCSVRDLERPTPHELRRQAEEDFLLAMQYIEATEKGELSEKETQNIRAELKSRKEKRSTADQTRPVVPSSAHNQVPHEPVGELS